MPPLRAPTTRTDRARGRARIPTWLAPYLIALVPSCLVMLLATSRILARAGEPALPLDDSFIHLQYARNLAGGRFFEYVAGEGYTSGATSFLWPLLLAPFFAAGLDGLALVPVTWIFGTLLHAATAYETWRLGRPLVGDTAAIAAGAMCSVFGAFAWFAASGMETMMLAWILLRGARVAAETLEWPARAATLAVSSRAEPRERQSPRAPTVELALLGLAAPLVRPEGALVSVIAAATLVLFARRSGRPIGAALALAPCLGPFAVPLSHLAFTGHAASATAMVKHLAFDPYLDRAAVIAASLANAKLLVMSLLDGGPWTAVFVPARAVVAIALGIVALPLCAVRRRAWFRAALVLALALGTLGPATYATMLWNRVRYIWPFAPAWFLLIAAACSELGARVRGGGTTKGRRFLGILEPALAWGAVTLFGAKLDWATRDLATSARAISRQQVALARWARHELPEDALVGVNDTGAIAYLSGRKTFDVVGLTTEGEAAYWAAGAGPRFEHYERVAREPAGRPLPTHFVVYEQWMAMPAVLGAFLHEATVLDQSILGGRTMGAFVADHSLFDSGARPLTRHEGEPTGELDVADLESERAHGYRLGDARAHYTVAAIAVTPSGDEVADGGRRWRAEDRFRLDVTLPVTLVMRTHSEEPLAIYADGVLVGTARAANSGATWAESELTLPQGAREVAVRPTGAGRFTSFHYWWYATNEGASSDR